MELQEPPGLYVIPYWISEDEEKEIVGFICLKIDLLIILNTCMK